MQSLTHAHLPGRTPRRFVFEVLSCTPEVEGEVWQWRGFGWPDLVRGLGVACSNMSFKLQKQKISILSKRVHTSYTPRTVRYTYTRVPLGVRGVYRKFLVVVFRQ